MRRSVSTGTIIGVLVLLFFAYAVFREPKVNLGPCAMDYSVSNRFLPNFIPDRNIPYASIRSLTCVPGRDGLALAIGYAEDGKIKLLRLNRLDIDSVGKLAEGLSKRSGITLLRKWSFSSRRTK